MLRNLAEKDELKKEKDDDIDKNAKEVEINENREIVYMDNDELVVDATNNTPPPQDTMTTTTTAASEEGGDHNDVGTEDSDNKNEADNTKWGE